MLLKRRSCVVTCCGRSCREGHRPRTERPSCCRGSATSARCRSSPEPMPRGGSKQGERRGGRKPGTPNKLPKGTKALVKLEEAEAQVRVLKAENRLETLGKARLTELDAWAYSMAQQFAPKTNAKTGRMEWEGEGDEARFMRLMKLCGEGAAGIRRAALLAQIG